MRNDLRDAIRGQAAYLKRTNVAFKDRAETQRCVPTEGAPFETAHGRIYSRRQKGPAGLIFLPNLPCGGAFTGPSSQRSVSVFGRAGRQLIMKRAAEGL